MISINRICLVLIVIWLIAWFFIYRNAENRQRQEIENKFEMLKTHIIQLKCNCPVCEEEEEQRAKDAVNELLSY